MNQDQGNSCPMPGVCQEGQGSLPPCAGLSVPYVPFQPKGAKKYTQTEALANGTLFPGLNLPFHLKVEGSAVPATPLTQLQALEFVVMELGAYLDTHADDVEAFALFQDYAAAAKEAKAAYEAQYGPLTQCSAANGQSFRWLEEPWPWNAQQ